MYKLAYTLCLIGGLIFMAGMYISLATPITKSTDVVSTNITTTEPLHTNVTKPQPVSNVPNTVDTTTYVSQTAKQIVTLENQTQKQPKPCKMKNSSIPAGKVQKNITVARIVTPTGYVYVGDNYSDTIVLVTIPVKKA